MEKETAGIRCLSYVEEPRMENLMHHVNVRTLKEEHQKQSKKKAVGIDGVGKEEYDVNIEENLNRLVERMKRFQYRPKEVRRTYIPKANGKLVLNEYLLYYFRTNHFKQSLMKYSNDSTNINNLNQEMLNAIWINAPDIAKQIEIVNALDSYIHGIEVLIAEKDSLISDLEAYKKSLIFEVVTGKRKVV